MNYYLFISMRSSFFHNHKINHCSGSNEYGCVHAWLHDQEEDAMDGTQERTGKPRGAIFLLVLVRVLHGRDQISLVDTEVFTDQGWVESGPGGAGRGGSGFIGSGRTSR